MGVLTTKYFFQSGLKVTLLSYLHNQTCARKENHYHDIYWNFLFKFSMRVPKTYTFLETTCLVDSVEISFNANTGTHPTRGPRAILGPPPKKCTENASNIMFSQSQY